MKKSVAKSRVRVRVKVLPHGDELAFPAYQSKEAAGMDLVAAVGADETITIAPGARVLIPTGLCLELPTGFEGQVRPRSGLALNHGIGVLNSPGTIDSDYRGEVKIILINLGEAPFEVRRGERIAQLVIAPVTQALLARVVVLADSARGAGGFGSTKINARPAQAAPPVREKEAGKKTGAQAVSKDRPSKKAEKRKP